MTASPAPCEGRCGRVVRPPKTTAAQHPNTASNRGRGYCPACYSMQAPVKTKRPENCVGCGVALRAKGAPADSAPGTREHRGQGFCPNCHPAGHNRRAKNPKNNEGDCVNCEHPLRPSGTTVTQFPGTHMSAGSGMCLPCYKIGGTEEPAPTEEDEPMDTFDLDRAKEAEQAFQRQREARRRNLKIIPVGGLALQINPSNNVTVVLKDGNVVGSAPTPKMAYRLALHLNKEM